MQVSKCGFPGGKHWKEDGFVVISKAKNVIFGNQVAGNYYTVKFKK